MPSLILQPLVENAFEHGISLLNKGEISIRTSLKDNALVLEVENDGSLTEQDKENIKMLLEQQTEGSLTNGNAYIGIRNVSKRLKLLYEEQGELTIEQLNGSRVLARIIIRELEYAKESTI